MGTVEYDLAVFEAERACEDAADSAREKAIYLKAAEIERDPLGEIVASYGVVRLKSGTICLDDIVWALAEQIVDAEAAQAVEDHRKGLDL